MQYVLYTKPGCSLCDSTKQLLNKHNISFQEYVIGKDITREETLKNFPNARVAPIVVLDGQMIQTDTLKMILENTTSKQLLLENEGK